MRQIIYVSDSIDPGNQADIDSIILQTRHNNALDGLSGLLWVSGRRFVQVIEGDVEVVGPTFERIMADPRHDDIRVLIDRTIERREFNGWSIMYLGYPETGRELDDRVRQAIAAKSEPVRQCFEDLIAGQ